MKLAANISLMFNDLPLLDRIQKAAELSFQGVEVQFPYELPVHDWQQALATHSMPLALINLPAGDFMQGGAGLAGHPERQEEFIAALQQARPYIETLQPDVLNILAGRQVEGYSREACLVQLQDNLKLACKLLADLPVRITCEPINNLDQPGYLTPRTDDWIQLSKGIKHPAFGLQLDLYHAARMGDDLLEVIKTLANQLTHIQFADCPGRSHPGSGSLHLMNCFTQLKQENYQGWIAAEFPCLSTDQFDWLPHIHGIISNH